MNIPLEHLSFRALFDELADAMLMVDQAGHIIMANPAAHALLGYAEDELCGLQVEALLPERYREHHRHSRAGYSTNPEKRSMGNGANLVALTRDGEELPLSIGLTPLKALGESTTLVTLYPDRRRQAEESLRASEEHLQLAKLAAGLGIFDRDLTRNILHWDQPSRELWGLTPEEDVTYEKFEAGIHPEDRAARDAIVQRALDPAGNGEYQAEFRVVRRNDGAVRWVAATGKVFFQNGRALRIAGVMRDITEYKTMEQKLQERRDETESLVNHQIAAQTASAIAHEINQPLAAISAYSEFALRDLQNSHVKSDSLCRALEGCVKQAQRAGNSLHELINFLQSGELVTEPMHLHSLVQEALVIANKDGYGKFNPLLHVEPDLPPVLGNPLQVQKVLLNLLRNGIEAIREAGFAAADITIKVSTRAGCNMAQVTVQDSGPGLNTEVAKRLFEPFFTTKPNGIGMGLTISRTLIESHGGQLWLDPEAAPGATFHFTLPFAP
ncbi:MAG TPA: PAS domain S-box protein [Anaerolineae bacterium]|nr:PAS domain S-box protein [Anaerolineae bacterium]